MNRAVVVFVLFLIGFRSFAQTDKDIVTINNAIEDHFFKVFKPNNDSLANACLKGILFVKIVVDSNRTFNSIAVSGEAPNFVKTALISAVDSMMNDHLLMTRLAKLRTTILKPVMYDLQMGCDFPKKLTDDKDSQNDFYKRHWEIAIESDQYANSLRKLLSFSDKEVVYVRCIVLGTMRFSISSH